MTPEQERRIKEVFSAAAELPEAERAAYLDRACAGDAAARAGAEALLAALGRAGGLMESSTAEAGPTQVPSALEGPGAMIGRYKLLQQIGEGGFGSVFLAEQREPVVRRVALKIIKLGMDTRQVIARFEAERQALAMMDHPNIAKVLDAGATESGRPYFVMELVRGDPITQYCDTNNLGVPQRLELFQQVCHAVQHAHQKGIIHRDIKPRNVLVTVADGRPIPKVIDFGIAKATSARLTEKTLFTEHRALIGTPEYMSPEQAEMTGVDIDTRSDIYSLGVLLYELLTGTTPFDSRQLRMAAFGEIQRIIREVEPPKPSTRLSTMKETLASVAAHRRSEPARLPALVRGDLDWIVMKCLEKDRTRRYDTANGLAMEVQRHLAGEPVLAAPPSAAYKLRKFARRHRRSVTAVAAIVLTLVLGVIGTTIGLVQAEARRRDAEKAETGQRRLAQSEAAARREADEKRTLADRKTEEAELEAYAANLIAADASLAANEPARVRARLDACPGYLRGWEWGWLDTRSDVSLLVFRGHGTRIHSATFSSDGTRIVTASADKTARVWHAATGQELILLRGHETDVKSAAFSPDGMRVVTASYDKTARVWDAATGQEIGVLRGHERGVNSAAFSPDGMRIVTASYDKTARVWDAVTGKEIALLGGHEGSVTSATFNPDGTRIVTASWTARLWDATSGRELVVFRGPQLLLTSAAFSFDGTRIVAASGDQTAWVWDAATGQEIAVLRGHERGVNSAAFSPDGMRIVTASYDKTARVWDAVTGQELVLLRGHEGHVQSAAFSPDGKRIVTASLDTTARVWEAATGQELAVLRGHERVVWSATFSPDGSRIVSASWDTTARVWDSEGCGELTILREHQLPLGSAAFSPDGARIVTASWDTTARMLDAATGKEVAVLRGHQQPIVTSAAFSPDGTRIVTASRDATARVWDAATGTELAVLRGHERGVSSAGFSPDGARIVTASSDRTARVWDAATGTELAVLGGHEHGVGSAAFSPDGTRIVTASGNNARVWNATTGTELALLRGHEHGVGSAGFSPDGARIVTASVDKTARVWDAATGEELAVLGGHEFWVSSAAFSPNGSRIVTASGNIVRVCDSATGTEFAVLRGHERQVTSAAFSPDGRRIVTASLDSTRPGVGERAVPRAVSCDRADSGGGSEDGPNRPRAAGRRAVARCSPATDCGRQVSYSRGAHVRAGRVVRRP